jgi:hypothetical protein
MPNVITFPETKGKDFQQATDESLIFFRKMVNTARKLGIDPIPMKVSLNMAEQMLALMEYANKDIYGSKS